MSCLNCARGMHPFCSTDTNEVCCCTKSEEIVEEKESDNEDESWRKTSTKRGRGIGKRDDSLRDQQSTGRKRAAVKYPLDRDASCEWQGLLCAGGGSAPIVGCLDGKQQARHHGPDKNTLNNDLGNVHRICHACHNRWHARNDEGYQWGSTYKPHDPSKKASDEEIWSAEREWFGKPLKKVTD